MPEVVSCPECSRKLRVPDEMIGKKVKCPGCAKVFATGKGNGAPVPPSTRKSSPQAPADEDRIEDKPRAAARRAAVPPPAEEEEDRPRGRRGRDEPNEDEDYPRRSRDEEEDEDFDDASGTENERESRQGWAKFRKGLTLLITGYFTIIGGGILWIILFFIMLFIGIGVAVNAAQNNQNAPMNLENFLRNMGIGMIVVVSIGFLLWLTVQGLELTGLFLHMSAPIRKGYNLKPLARTALGMQACYAVCVLLIIGAFIYMILTLPNSPSVAIMTGIQVIQIVSMLFWMAASVAFLFVLRGACLALGRQSLAKHVMAFIITAGSVAGVYILTTLAAFFLVGSAAMVGVAGNQPANAAGQAVSGGAAVLGLVNCLVVLAAIAVAIWYIVVLFLVRGAVSNHLDR